ncbi:MAG: radical SAM protein [Methylococcales bacterium]
MITTVYIEKNIQQHPRVAKIVAQFPKARQILCERYGEVFNPKAQNFRLQKQQPALILAEKFQQAVLPAPPGYGIGAKQNYYFSHMLNCLYDCRYCFLQGMYQSANYVLFINYEDFQQQILDICRASPDEELHFFSGYDGDSLALEPLTGFAEHFVDFFETLPNAKLELRTKSTQVRGLLKLPAAANTVVAFSLSPDAIAQKVEEKAPTVAKRLEAIIKCQEQGWAIGLRFDPLIYRDDFQTLYADYFAEVFARIDLSRLHSVSLGVFRLPEKYFKKMHKLYPEARLFAGPLEQANGMVSYRVELEQEMMQFCTQALLKYIPSEKFFPCRL